MKAFPFLLIAVLCGAQPARAQQRLSGYAAVMFDVLPDVALAAAGQQTSSPRQRVSELRTRLFAERRFDVGTRFRVTAAGFAEGFVGQRARTEAAALVRPQELHAEVLWPNADVRVGLSRVVWGRLDEFLPTDVVNPLDLTRFFLEGRVEGRLPVAMVRGRVIPSERLTLEMLYVPVFKRARFDQLDEDTSPFTLVPPLAGELHEPRHTWSNAQGGARASVTSGRVDWSASVYRGFEPLPLYDVALQAGAARVEGRFPRFTMLGGDFETVVGAWGVRGEVAGFVERTLQIAGEPATVSGHTVEAGVGADRRAGDYRVSMNVVISGRTASDHGVIDDTDTLLVASVDRSFARETGQLRAFGVYNAGEDSAFARVIASFSLRDNVTLETSGGWFSGHGLDAFSQLASRDFLYARVKVFF